MFIAPVSCCGAAGRLTARCRSDFGRKIVRPLLDALAHDEQRECVDRGAFLLQQLLDRQLSSFTNGCPSSVTSFRYF